MPRPESSLPKITTGLRLFSRRGQLLLWTPSSTEPFEARPLDVAVIAMLAARQNGNALLTDVYRWLWAEVEDSPNRQHLRAVLQRLSATGFLAGGSGSEAAPKSLACETEFESMAVQSVASSARLKWQRNACFQVAGKGFVFSSRTVRQPCRVPMDAVLFALGFVTARSPIDVMVTTGISEVDGLRTTGRLLGSMLLVPAPEETTAEIASRNEAIASAVRLGSDDPWSDVMPDHRKPIYFVTHSDDHLPLALGMIRSFIETFGGGALMEHYHPLPIIAMKPADLLPIYRRFGPGVWMFSNYMWSIAYNLEFSRAVKAELGPDNLTIHGGPSTPKYEGACQQFMYKHPHVDFAVRGEGEITVAELLSAIATEDSKTSSLADIAGVTYRSGPEPTSPLVRTAERFRALDVDQFPSPYLRGAFDSYGGAVVAAILETNRGCPYACTFCDWGSATQQKIKRYDTDRIRQEIEWIGRNRIRVLWIADANFGIFKRDVEITQYIADTKERYGYPKEVVVNYPKNATRIIAEVVRILVEAGICGQGVISIQTTDPHTLQVIRRDNIKTSKYDELGRIFRSQNLPLSTDLMIGLPGATVESFKGDLQYYFDDDVAVKAYRTQLLPNSPMADPKYVSQNAIVTDADKFLISTCSYTEQNLDEMLWIWTVFDIADGYALLRYVLRYLQWDHGISATDFVHRLSITGRNNPLQFPTLHWFLRYFLRERFAPGGWLMFYKEIRKFAELEFNIEPSAGFEVALRVNELMMPDEGRQFPTVVSLDHDFATYFANRHRTTDEAQAPLTSYGSGKLTITDPLDMCHLDYEAIEQYDSHQIFYELDSEISRLRSDSSFVKNRIAS